MNRREATIVLVALGAVPRIAEAQQVAKVPRIGFLALNLAASPQVQAAFLQGLRDLGYVEGRNLVIETRDAEVVACVLSFGAAVVAGGVRWATSEGTVLLGPFIAGGLMFGALLVRKFRHA